VIQGLIDKQDNFEIIRDQVAAILKLESTSQQALAIAAGKDQALWKLRVYRERANPWESVRDQQDDLSPIINVWFDNASFDDGSSNISERQKSETVINIDCVGFAVSSPDGQGGHQPGDREAAFAVQRAIRLVRNILMASEYTYLGLRGLVWKRWPQSITTFQPQQDGRSTVRAVGARISLRVDHNEFSPQYQGQELELLTAQVTETNSGEIVILAEYDYT